MQDLIERLENASGPDRDLDAAIAKAVGADHGPREFVHVESRSYSVHDEIAKRYTASLDAAMTLIPEGHYWSFDSRGCGIVSGDEPPLETQTVGTCLGHASPAIGFCIAALRARQPKPQRMTTPER